MEYSWFLAGVLMAVFTRRQCARNHPSPHRIFSDFLSSLNHGAIHLGTISAGSMFSYPFYFPLTSAFLKNGLQPFPGWEINSHPSYFCYLHHWTNKKTLIYLSFWSNAGNGPEHLHFAWTRALVVSLRESCGMLITSVTNQGDDLSAIPAFWPWLADKRVIE